MMLVSQVRDQLTRLIEQDGDQPLLVDIGLALVQVEEVDLGTEGEGIIIWCGDRVEDD
ncbi:MAG: hypothetical protein AB7T17_06795 [Geobacter sp.]